MSENNTENTIEINQKSELDTLKARADLMQIKYNPNIGVDKLRLKIQNVLEGTNDDVTTSDTTVPDAPVEQSAAKVKSAKPEVPAKSAFQVKREREAFIRKEASKLIRIQVTCMNPNKREWPGETISVSNKLIGVHKKFVPFNNAEGWHVPQVIVNAMKEKKCQIFTTKIDNKGRKSRKGKLIPEYSIVVMDPLTKEELVDLAKQQAMSGSIDRDDD